MKSNTIILFFVIAIIAYLFINSGQDRAINEQANSEEEIASHFSERIACWDTGGNWDGEICNYNQGGNNGG